MKKKFLLLLPCFLYLVIVARAQDFEPGQQAQGYLEGKNITVDYATGIFHYNVPLYTFHSGGFQLPVYLEYTGKGVKEEDRPGMVGYNWILNTGGVVARIIRGGIADEVNEFGFLWAGKNKGELPLREDAARVNKHERDGECDIFTAVFNGQSVSFVLELDESECIRAVPLEKTNVRVECETSPGGNILGWTVTDEDGNRYIYKQREWTVNIYKEDAISFNGIRDKTYVSAWYLSRVEPLNAEPIMFNYMYTGSSWVSDKMFESVMSYKYITKYDYGRPLQERVFDFSKYEGQFNAEINAARDQIGYFNDELRLENFAYEFSMHGNWVRNPDFESAKQMFALNQRVMGQLAEFRYISNVSDELIRLLNELHDYYWRQSSPNAQMAASYFMRAKECVKRCVNEINHGVTTKCVAGRTSYRTYSPVLTSITCRDKMMSFSYSSLLSSGCLQEIELRDVVENKISSISIDCGDLLRGVSFRDRNGLEVSSVTFDYYTDAPGGAWGYDVWGFRKRLSGNEDEEFQINVDGEYAKLLSLKSVSLPYGGKVMVDYESNEGVNKGLDFMREYFEPIEYGGIRLKILVLDDGTGVLPDTIHYEYPYPGISVFGKCFNFEWLEYSHGLFSDKAWYSRVKEEGSAFLNTGNNGLYYKYVKEIITGKGTNTFLFLVPTADSYFVLEDQPYAFWLNGLPLATGSYDVSGNLKRLVKNRYYTDFSFAGSLLQFYLSDCYEYFEVCDTVFRYDRNVPQLKVFEYYMDPDYINQYYKNQGVVYLYRDGDHSYSLDVYEEVFRPNILPRITVVGGGNNYYNLVYGGKTLLKEQLEYRFEGNVTDSVSITDFSTLTRQVPHQKVEYFYDNGGYSVRPTRLTRTDLQGDSYTTVVKRVTEVDAAVDPAIKLMKRKNVLSPVVKQLKLKNGLLLNESVSCFEAFEVEEKVYAGAVCEYFREPEVLAICPLEYMDRDLFLGGREAYTLEVVSRYMREGCSYVRVEEENRSETTSCCYDFKQGQVILKAKNTKVSRIAATDMKRYDDLNSVFIRGGFYILNLADTVKKFYDVTRVYREEAHEEWHREFLETPAYKLTIELVRIIAERDQRVPVTRTYALLDSVCKNNNRYLDEFYAGFERLFMTSMDVEHLVYYLRTVYCWMNPEVIDADFFKYLYMEDRQDYCLARDTIRVDSFPESGRLKLFVVSDGESQNFFYEITHAGGSRVERISCPFTRGYSLHAFEIDIRSYEGVVSVQVIKPPYENLVYMALVPEGVEFEATSYNVDGTVLCKFNQNGQVEFDEYDTVGRLVRVKDQNGNVIKENRYNVAGK